MRQIIEIAEEQLRIARRIDELIDMAEERFEGREDQALELALELADLVQRSMALSSSVVSIREGAEQLFNARCYGGPQ